MHVTVGYIIYSLSLIAIGWLGYGIIKLNTTRHFLSKAGYLGLMASSFAFNLVGAFYCIRGLFGF